MDGCPAHNVHLASRISHLTSCSSRTPSSLVQGHTWIGLDISPAMLEVAADGEVGPGALWQLDGLTRAASISGRGGMGKQQRRPGGLQPRVGMDMHACACMAPIVCALNQGTFWQPCMGMLEVALGGEVGV